MTPGLTPSGPDGLSLLRGLGGTRPDAAAPARLTEGPSFDALLEAARTGEASSGIPVRVASGAGVSLSDDQLARLSAAADAAEAKGASRAVVLIDGMALTMDVPVRTITGSVPTDRMSVMPDIDALIAAPPAKDANHAQGDALLRALNTLR